MNAPISNPAECEVRGVIRFLQASNIRPSETHRRLVAVYGEHVMNAASVWKWCTLFRNGRTDVHDAERSGRPSVITHALKQKVNCIIRENRHFTISEVYEQCPEVSRTVVYEIISEHLQYRKIDSGLLARGGISKLVSMYKCLIFQCDYVEKWVKVCDKTCIFCFFPIINKYLCMAKRSLLSERPSYLKRKTEARSCNRYCCGTAVSIKYTKCMSVSLIIQHALCMPCITQSLVACMSVSYGNTLSHKRHDFRKKLTIKWVHFLYNSNTFIVLKRIQSDVTSVRRSSWRVPVILVRF